MTRASKGLNAAMRNNHLSPAADGGLVDNSSGRGLVQLAEQAVRCTPDSCGAAATVTIAQGTPDSPVAVTHPDLSSLVSVQWESGEGPIHTALDSGEATGADDLLREQRWPAYRAKALEAGVRSSATFPYHRDGLAVTVTIYGFRPGLMAEEAEGPASLLGAVASTGLARERRYREALVEVDQLDSALRSRPVVDQACGILMYVLDCDVDTAFDSLRQLSQRTNRKLSDLAGALVRTRGHGVEEELRRLDHHSAGRDSAGGDRRSRAPEPPAVPERAAP